MNDADRKAFEDWKVEQFQKGEPRISPSKAWQAACEWRDSQVGKPIGWRVAFEGIPRGSFTPGKPDEALLSYAKLAGYKFEYCYAAPPTTQINQQLVDSLQEFIDFHVSEAGITAEIISHKEKFNEFLEQIEKREKQMIEQAQAALNAAKSGDV